MQIMDIDFGSKKKVGGGKRKQQAQIVVYKYKKAFTKNHLLLNTSNVGIYATKKSSTH